MRKLKTIFIKEEIENVHGIKDSVLRDFNSSQILPTSFNATPNKIPRRIFFLFFFSNWQVNSKICMEMKRTKNSKNGLEEEQWGS